MNLPNYFLADLPPEATLSPAMVADACQTLKNNREQYLLGRSTQSLINLLCEVADNWQQANYPFRHYVLEQGPAATGFSRETLARGLDSFFKQFTPENFNALFVQDLGHIQRLDEPAATNAELRLNRAGMARGAEFIFHIAAGNIPNPALMSMALGLLTRSAQLLKCGSGASFIPRLFAHSLYEADRKVAACLEVAEWRGGNHALEEILFHQADCVTATGDDETLDKIRHHLPAQKRFLAYGQKLSFGYVTGEILTGFAAKKYVARAVDDIVAWDQNGCLSPHVIYVEHGGGASAEQFAEMLAEELAKREASEPRGELPVEAAATIASRRAFYEVRAAHSPETTRHWFSEGSTAWTVIYESDSRFQMSCLNRFIYVKGVSDLTQLLRGVDELRGKISTVGLAAPEHRAQEIVTKLSQWGITRVCPLGQMQNPPLLWRHDGRPGLADLITWTDWEQ